MQVAATNHSDKRTVQPARRNWPLESLIRINPIYAQLAAVGRAPRTARAMELFLQGNLAHAQAVLILAKHLPEDLTNTKQVRDAFIAAIREA